MIGDTLLPVDLVPVEHKKVTADFEGGSISSDGWLMLLRGMERRVGPAETLLGCIREWRASAWAVHTLPAMLSFRMFAIDRLRIRRRRRLRRSARQAAVQAGGESGAGKRAAAPMSLLRSETNVTRDDQQLTIRHENLS